jgi:hypothetical protein
VSRANGFDLDQDGIVAEAGVDDLICDSVGGSISAGNFYEEDLYGDASLEEQIFVDCNTPGNDDSVCGPPGDPCSSLNYALNTRLDGNGDGQVSVICFKGTCTPDDVSVSGGIAGSYTRTKSGNEVYDTTLPAEPLIISGWDNDGDNSYPPHDTDDTSIMDGTGIGNAGPLQPNNDYIEFAHFSVDDYDPNASSDSFVETINLSYYYFHDLYMTDMANTAAAGTPRWISGGGDAQHEVFENIYLNGGGSFVFRSFYGEGTDYGPFLVKNFTFLGDDADHNGLNFYDITGWITKVTVIDSYFDTQAVAWETPPYDPRITFQVSECNDEVSIINSYMAGYSTAISVGGGQTGFCNTTPRVTCGTFCTFDRNELVFDVPYPTFSDTGIFLAGAKNYPNRPDGDITATNNIIYNVGSAQLDAALLDRRKNDTGVYTGTVTFVGNTIYRSAGTSRGAIWLDDQTATYQPQNYVIKNNIINFGGDTPVTNIHTEWAPSNWDSDYNIFDADAGYNWAGSTSSTLAGWQTDSSGDANSDECDPTFVGSVETAAGLHLDDADTCAQENGVALVTITTIDYDGEDRSEPWDIGADENSDAGGDPSPPASPDQGVNFTGVSKSK